MEIGSIVSIAVAVISACVGPICVYMFKRAIDKRDAKVKKAEELRQKQEEELHKARKEEEELKHKSWQNEVKDMLRPVVTDVADIKKDIVEQKADLASVKTMLESNEAATILELRVDMKSIRDRHVIEGKKLDTGDIATWKELYKRYSEMGGNHFKEYVDSWGKEIGLTAGELRQLRDEAAAEATERHER